MKKGHPAFCFKVDADVPAALLSSEAPLGTYAAGTSASTLTAEPLARDQELVNPHPSPLHFLLRRHSPAYGGRERERE